MSYVDRQTQGLHPGLPYFAPFGAPEPEGRDEVAQGVSPGWKDLLGWKLEKRAGLQA